MTPLLFLIFLATCTSVAYGISGGSSTIIREFPHAVSLQRHGNHICGGSIIGEWHVLTAAHCFSHDTRAVDLTILSGTDDLEGENPSIHNIVMIIFHPEYNNSTYSNDIAVLKLRDPIAFSKIRQPIALATARNKNSRVHGKLCGWGPAHGNEIVPSRFLKKLELQIIDFADNTNPRLHAMTTNGANTDGDDGGGLVHFGELVGVLIRSNREMQYVSTFSRVAHYRSWIKEVYNY